MRSWYFQLFLYDDELIVTKLAFLHISNFSVSIKITSLRPNLTCCGQTWTNSDVFVVRPMEDTEPPATHPFLRWFIHSLLVWLYQQIEPQVKISICRLRVRSTILLRSPVKPNLGVRNCALLLRFYIYLRWKIWIINAIAGKLERP